MKPKKKIFILVIVLGSAVVFGCASTSKDGYDPDETPDQKLTFILEADPTSSKSTFEFLGEGEILFINKDSRNPYRMEGEFKGGWSVFDEGTTRFYGVCDPDGMKNSGDEIAFTVCLCDYDLNGTDDMINLRIHDFQTGIRFFECRQTLKGEYVKINISEV